MRKQNEKQPEIVVHEIDNVPAGIQYKNSTATVAISPELLYTLADLNDYATEHLQNINQFMIDVYGNLKPHTQLHASHLQTFEYFKLLLLQIIKLKNIQE